MELDLQSWFTVVIGALAIGILLLIRFMRRNDDYWKKRGIPYAPRISILHTMWKFYKQPVHEMLLQDHNKYGKVSGSFLFLKPMLVVSDPEFLKDILVKDFHIFSSRMDIDMGDNIFGKMVSALRGEDWKRVRTIITPAFTSRKMRKIAHIINSCSETVIQTLSEHHDKGIPFDCRKVFGAFTMDVIASSAFATKIDSHHDPNNPFVEQVKNMIAGATVIRFALFLLVPPKFWKFLPIQPIKMEPLEFFRSVTLQVIEERRKKGQKGNDFLQLMLDASDEVIEGEEKVQAFQTMDLDEEDHYGRIDSNSRIVYTTKKLSQEEIIAQCVLFFLVGYETTALTLSYLAYNLAINPDCQEKLIKEVDEVFEKKDEITYDDVRDMKYLDCCFSESMRLYPILISTERCAQEDYKLGDTGITIEKGLSVAIPVYAMHYDPEYYPDPEKFDPERFMGDNRQNLRPYTYLPFGAGPRNCLGMRFAIMEIKLCVANVLRHYRFRRAPQTKVPLDFVFAQGFLSIKELPLLVEKRTDAKKFS